MKKNILPVLVVLSIIVSCKNYKNEFDKVLLERDSLIFESDIKDSSIHLFMSSFDEIEANLDTITEKQNALEQDSMHLKEANGDQRERINEDIRIINRMLERNRLLIVSLKQQNNNKNNRIAELQSVVNKLTQEVESKEAELLPLKIQLDEKNKNLESLNLQIDSLTASNIANELKIKEKNDKLNTAYFIIDNYKKLRTDSILDSKGGFLGIGKNQMLKQDFKTDGFTKINITETISIPLDCKAATIITNHPSGSYTLVKEKDVIKSLDIKDYEKFWGASKYLVIVKN